MLVGQGQTDRHLTIFFLAQWWAILSGDADRPTHPRSAVKPLQALPLIETGAAADLCVVDDAGVPSGGNVYDRRVCDLLPAMGWSVLLGLVTIRSVSCVAIALATCGRSVVGGTRSIPIASLSW